LDVPHLILFFSNTFNFATQEALVKIGIQFSHAFQQTNTQNREQYKAIEGGSPFKNCQAHFGIWNGVGQDVSTP
jgi:hypothetical protein